MQPFRVHRGRAVPLLRQDIDTDQIIPKQFLKSIERTGFGEHLFHDWRFQPDGTPNPTFVLNDPRYAGASILIVGANFGCGSSREHAAWALEQSGFRVLIAPSFADIFRSNAVTNGVLPLALNEDDVALLGARAAEKADYHVAIDLDGQRVSDDEGFDRRFAIDEASRQRLLKGLDDIDAILQHAAAIGKYEETSLYFTAKQ